MRKSFDGLSGLIRRQTSHNLLSGDVFIFINRRADRIKLLMWDVTGFALYYKRLEKGMFSKSVFSDNKMTIELTWSDLVMMLEGIEISEVKRRKRYRKKHSKDA